MPVFPFLLQQPNIPPPSIQLIQNILKVYCFTISDRSHTHSLILSTLSTNLTMGESTADP